MATASSNHSTENSKCVEFVQRIRERVATVVVGQDVVVERTLIALFTGGHPLLQGVPGLAKTLLVSVLSKTVDLDFARIQFTIDLLPSDILGSEILDQRTSEFKILKGPIFTNLLLADEINRAAPKVQGALLEAMQERKVTIGNETFTLPAPFLVIATQNPIEQSGTFELPEAQLDRFMLCHRLNYPTPEEEKEVLRRNSALGITRKDKGAIAKTEFDVLDKEPVGTAEDLIDTMHAVQDVHISDVFMDHVVELVNRTRIHPALEVGCSPRAGIALLKSSKARAMIHGRSYVVPEDMYSLAEDVILHRIRLNYEALADGLTGESVLQSIMNEMGLTASTISDYLSSMKYQLDSIDTLDSRQFIMAVKRLADSLSYGTDASPFLGSGTEYVQSRLYQPGDPVRSIDWRITARTNKFHVKEFETPKRMPCYLLIDSSASMTVSSTVKSKYAVAVYISGGLAFACLDRISPVAVMGVGETELRYNPSLSRDKIMQWLHKLRTYHTDEKTMLEARLRELGPLLRNRSLIIVLSDLHQPEAIRPLKRLGQQHDVVALQLQDPAETDMRGVGFVRGREAETTQTVTTRGRNLGIDQEELKQELKRARVDHLLVKTNEPIAYQLRHFFKSRGLLGRGAR